jgi:methylmalonyl-CoA mutase N-terminal domain/subunit
VEEGERVVVGVNRFRDDEVHTPDLQRIDPTAERGQVDRVRRLRAERDPDAWSAALDRLGQAADRSENLLPPIIDAVKAHATLGEISDRLRVAFGEHRELITV